jgi:hypothetical protein
MSGEAKRRLKRGTLLRILELSPPLKRGLPSSSAARMAKLADALASGASGRKVVQVQVLFRAQRRSPAFRWAIRLFAHRLTMTQVEQVPLYGTNEIPTLCVGILFRAPRNQNHPSGWFCVSSVSQMGLKFELRPEASFIGPKSRTTFVRDPACPEFLLRGLPRRFVSGFRALTKKNSHEGSFSLYLSS